MKPLAILLIVGLLLPLITLNATAQDTSLPTWNATFPSSQEIILPIDTSLARAKGQPVDLPTAFHNPCWTKDQYNTSVRIVSWNGSGYTELPSQIYNLVYTDSNHIHTCNIVFLVPAFANGKERYFLFYSQNQTPATNYTRHLQIVDQTYQFNPIQQIQANAQFYGIIEDNYDVFGIGQEGKILDRACAQVVVKQPANTTHFDALNADQFVSFAFSYYYGPNEKDESSSDQVFLNKQILVTGPLMVSVLISSQSSLSDVRTTNEYRYYYTPSPDKRLFVHVNHQMLQAATVQGMTNIDGRFGSIISVKARSSQIPAVNMGTISPLLDFNSTTQPIEEYQMDQNPETTDREWIIPYQDNADLGPQAWISYGDGPTGVANAVIFQSNTGIIKTGTNEHDGITLKVCEKQYFDFLSTQVDYASLNFGRNSYDPTTGTHDTSIPANLQVDFNAETFYSKNGGYTATQQEASLFQALIQNHIQKPEPGPNATRFNLTVNATYHGQLPQYFGLGQKTGTTTTAITTTLYRNTTYLTTQTDTGLLLTNATTHFTNLTTGHYLIKIQLSLTGTRYLIGTTTLTLNTTKSITIPCTWERDVKINIQNQHTHPIPNVTIRLQNKNNQTLDQNTTDTTGTLTLRAAYNTTDPYTITATYKNHTVTTTTLPPTKYLANTTITLPLYNLTIKVVDTLNLPPTINITPHLTSTRHNTTTDLTPDTQDTNTYHFTNLLAGNYTAILPYRNHIDTQPITIPTTTPAIQLTCTQTYPLTLDFYDQRGNTLPTTDILTKVYRDNNPVKPTLKNTLNLPPATYQLYFYNQNTLIATKTIDLTNEHQINIVTSLDSPLPPLIIGLSIALFSAIAILTVLRKTTLRTLLLTLTFSLILLTLALPWWELSGTSTTTPITRHIAMFIQPGSLMETITNHTATQRSVSEMPVQFTNFLGIVGIMLASVGVLTIVTAAIAHYHRLRVTLIVQTVLVALLAATAIVYVYGTSILTDIGIGSLQGHGTLPVTVDNVDLSMISSWGLSSGYYLILVAGASAVVGLVLTVYEWLRTRESSTPKN